MNKQLYIEQNNNNLTPPPYRFDLYNASGGPLTVKYAPDGWDENEIEVNRSNIFHGIITSISIKEMLMHKDAKEYLHQIYETGGINQVVTVTIYAYDYNTFEYVLYYNGTIDWVNYKINEVDLTTQFGNTGFWNKIVTRSKTKVNVLNKKSINGYEFTDFPLNTIELPDTSIDSNSDFLELPTPFITDAVHVVPCGLQGGGDFNEAQSQILGSTINNKNSASFKESENPRQVVYSGNIAGEFLGPTGPFDASIEVYINTLDSDSNVILTTGIGIKEENGVDSMSFSFDFSETITLLEGQSAIVQSNISPTNEKFNYSSVTVNINETVEGTPSKLISGYMVYEMFLRCLQIITDTDNPLYSEYFGRTDSPLTPYAQDGNLLSIAKGEFFRDLQTGAFTTSFEDLFKAVNVCYPISLSLVEMGGVQKVRIEPLAFAYPENVILDLSSQLREENIEKQLNADMVYSEIKTGFTKSLYEESGGLFEYNTNSNFSTVLTPIENLYSIVSKIRADYSGMKKLMRAEDNTEDVAGDEDNFFITTKRGVDKFIALTDEDFESVGGSFYANKSLNLDITPARNLVRHHDMIQPCLRKNLNSYIRHQGSDKSTQLTTKKAGEVEIVENGDIFVDDLQEPLFFDELYNINVALTPTQRSIIINENGLVKVASDKYGWADTAQVQQKDGVTQLSLKRANLNRITPIEL